jgi:hypothetical protein
MWQTIKQHRDSKTLIMGVSWYRPEQWGSSAGNFGRQRNVCHLLRSLARGIGKEDTGPGSAGNSSHQSRGGRGSVIDLVYRARTSCHPGNTDEVHDEHVARPGAEGHYQTLIVVAYGQQGTASLPTPSLSSPLSSALPSFSVRQLCVSFSAPSQTSEPSPTV